MIIVIGLGNPGEQFKETRHNIGFMAIDFFAKKNELEDFSLEKKYEALMTEGKIGKEKIVLAKPQTFMNESGKSAKKIKTNHKGQIIVMHDDIDLPLGTIKIVENRGSAGHKGVESVIKAVGNKGLIRIRMGIQPKKGKPKEAEKIVVKKFEKEDVALVNAAVKKAAGALEVLINEGLQKTMNEYNR